MKSNENLNNFFRKYSMVALFAKYVTLWKDICFVLSLWLNFVIITSFRDSNSPIFGSFNDDNARLKAIDFMGVLSK